MAIKSWLTLLVSFLLFQTIAKADSLFTTVFNVFPSEAKGQLMILSAADGRVYKTYNNEENLLRMKSLIGQVVKLDYSLNGTQAFITDIQLANPSEVDTKTMDLNHFRYNELRQFAPTDLQSIEVATNIFNNLMNDGEKNRSQCFKRAHMWAFDMWTKSGIKSEKIYLFYTRRYQDLEDFEWWFHVAPMVTVQGEKYVMDGAFMKQPVTLKEWTTKFIKTDKITCPFITHYQEYDQHQWNRLCYLMKTPMYYFRPLDMEARDLKGAKKNHWVLEELQDARRAFKNWEESYEGLDNGKRTIKY
jgi:hypothetical protein